MTDIRQDIAQTQSSPRPASTPTPEDPRQNTPMQDPPVHPEHDPEEVRLHPDDEQPAGSGENAVVGTSSDVKQGRPDDRTLFDENKTAR